MLFNTAFKEQKKKKSLLIFTNLVTSSIISYVNMKRTFYFPTLLENLMKHICE